MPSPRQEPDPVVFGNPMVASQDAAEFDGESGDNSAPVLVQDATETFDDQQSSKLGRQMSERQKMNTFLQRAIFGAAVEDVEGDDSSHLHLKQMWGGLLHPDTNSRSFYDFVQLSIMVYLGWALPTRLAFSKVAESWTEIATDIFIDASVVVDMIISMHQFEYDSKTRQLMTDRKRIKRRYMKSWFIVDVLSVVPIDHLLFLIGALISNHSKSDEMAARGFYLQTLSTEVRMIRLVRLVRLFRMGKLLNMDNVVGWLMAVVGRFGVLKLTLEFQFRVMFLMLLMVTTSHFLGCLWLLLGRTNCLEASEPAGWMTEVYAQYTCPPGITDANCPLDVNRTKDYISCISEEFNSLSWNQRHGSICQGACVPIPKGAPYDVDCSWITEDSGGTSTAVGASERDQYLTAFYFSLVTISTVGYGEILPTTYGEKQFVVFGIILGAFMYAFVIGDFSNLITNMSREKSEFDAKMRSINDMLGYIDAPFELRAKVQEFYDYKYANKEGPASIFTELPKQIQTDIVKQRWSGIIAKVPFFKDMTDRTIVDVCRAMKCFSVAPMDCIMEVGQEGSDLLILSKGTAMTKGEDDENVEEDTAFEPGSFWGELQFLGLSNKRTLKVVATSFCEVATLKRADIRQTLRTSPVLRHRLEHYAKMRKAIEDKMKTGEDFDMDTFTAALEKKYREEDMVEIDHEGVVVPEALVDIASVGQAIGSIETRLMSQEKKLTSITQLLGDISRKLGSRQ